MPFSFFSRNKNKEEEAAAVASSNTTEAAKSEQPPQKPAYTGLQPPAGAKTAYQGLGIGRQSKTPVVSTVDLSEKEKSQFFTDCKKEYLAAINCRLEHHDHKETNICQPLFDHYKDCRTEEHERRLEENAKKGGFF